MGEAESSPRSSITSDSNATAVEGCCCSICGARLGKRHLTLKHECRMCSRAVCAACSPNSVKLQGDGKAQRACSDCLSSVGKLPEMAVRLTNISTRLNNLCVLPAGSRASSSTQASLERPSNFDDAVALCESAVTALEREQDRLRVTQKRVELLEVEGRVARASSVRLVQRIHALQRTKPPANLQTASLEEALAFCEAALVPLEDRRTGCSYMRRTAVDAEIERVISGTSEASSQMHEGVRSQPGASQIGPQIAGAQPLLPRARCFCSRRWRLMLGLLLLVLMLVSVGFLVYFRVVPLRFTDVFTSTATKLLLHGPRDSTLRVDRNVIVMSGT